MTTHCDECAVLVTPLRRNMIPCLPINITRKRAGQSAVLCPNCYRQLQFVLTMGNILIGATQ